MKCKCGCNRFYGHQIVRMDVICDEYGNFDSDITEGLESAIYDSEKPYGPFTCVECGEEYDELT